MALIAGLAMYSYLHNQRDKDFPADGWVDRVLLRRYEKKLAEEGD